MQQILSETLNFFPLLSIGQAPPKVKSVYPDSRPLLSGMIPLSGLNSMCLRITQLSKKETVIVRSSASNEPVHGLLDIGSRMLMFRPYEEYPIDESGAEITVTLPGSETGSGFIMDGRGIALDGDGDGKPGGD